MAHTLPDLPYAYDALSKAIDEETMRIHHDLHHGGYVKKLNAALEGTGLEDTDLAQLLGDLNQVPEDKRTAVRNNGGGHYNHTLFWEIMIPEGGEPSEDLANAINAKFGSVEEFKQQFSDAAATRFGSGWAWLSVKNGELELTSTANQDNPVMEGSTPILGLDVWEHAYYLRYQNKRPDYIGAWWEVVNWAKVSEKYSAAKA